MKAGANKSGRSSGAGNGSSRPGGSASASSAAAGASAGPRTAGSGAGSAAAGGAASGSGGSGSDERDPAATRKPFLWLVLGLAVVAAIVVGIVVIGFNSGDEDSTPVSETSAPSDQPTKKEEKTPKADPPKIESVESLDPEGDGEEHDSETENVIPKTEGSWNTDRYNSASFGNLKTGVGLLFGFEDETTISEVKVASESSGGKFEIRDGDDPADAKVIGEGVFDSEGAVTVEFDEKVETDELILWVTELPQTDGGYKATISSVKFS